ncbi:MAG: hypothetical protein M4579_000117 [Chaenotheca gracillima]|nr:MAG: hypothetical protein M4579_000117 [Chaenotheca gracillima]
MSGRSPIPGHFSHSPQESSVPKRPHESSQTRGDEVTLETSNDPSEPRPELLPPINPLRRSTTPTTTTTEAGSSRSLHVHNILNPTYSDTTEPRHDGHRTGRRSRSPPSTTATPSQRSSSLSRPHETEASHSVTRHVLTPSSSAGRDSESGAPPREPRRILTPKSLSSLPVSTLGRLSFPGTINAQESPFLSSQGRPYTGEMGPVQIPEGVILTDHHTGGRGSGMPYGYVTSAPSPPPGSRRTSLGPMPAPHSQSASPSTSYSSFSQQSQTSPAPQHGLHPVSASGIGPPFGFSPQTGSGPHGQMPKTSYRPSSDSMPQGGVQLWTLSTEHGPIQVPVDVQAASKMADDKRKRNAGASARFRQRRKEKEREASQTISKLEQQMRDLAEERDFYRQERDYFRRMVSSSPSHGQQTPRPPSPRLRRTSREESSVDPQNHDQWRDPGPNEAERNTRRRTDAYPPGPAYSLPPPNTMVAPSQMPQGYGLPPMASPPYYDPRAGSSNVPAPPMSTPKVEPYEPSLNERFPRNWPGTQDPRESR